MTSSATLPIVADDVRRLGFDHCLITRDASGEVGDGGSGRNNCLSLGLVRNLFRGMLEVSQELGVDADRRDRWQDILNRLSAFPTVDVEGVRRLRGAEAGPAASWIGPSRNNMRLEFMGMVWPSTVARERLEWATKVGERAVLAVATPER